MGAEQPVDEKELTPTPLCRADLACFVLPVYLVEPQGLKYADSCVDRGMGRAMRVLAIPPTVGHLLFKEVIGNCVDALIVVLKV
jgi:hypothetical protein